MADTSKPKARPDDWEWADAPLCVTRIESPKGTVIYRLEKTIRRGRTRFTQSLWINQHQLDAMARDHAAKRIR